MLMSGHYVVTVGVVTATMSCHGHYVVTVGVNVGGHYVVTVGVNVTATMW